MSASDKSKLDSFFLDGLAAEIDTLIHALDAVSDILVQINTKNLEATRAEIDKGCAVVDCVRSHAKVVFNTTSEAIIPFRDAVRGAKHETS